MTSTSRARDRFVAGAGFPGADLAVGAGFGSDRPVACCPPAVDRGRAALACFAAMSSPGLESSWESSQVGHNVTIPMILFDKVGSTPPWLEISWTRLIQAIRRGSHRSC